jgi:hypothetical protein
VSDIADRSIRIWPTGTALVVLLVAAVLLMAPPSPASACSCAPNPPPGEARDQAAAVFAGTVVETRTVAGGGSVAGGPDDLVARVEVEEVFDGEVAATVDVSTSTDDGLCGLGFATGDRWLFYVSDDQEGGFSTHACTRTAALEYAADDWETSGAAERDLEALGASTEPMPGEQLREDSSRPWGLIVIAALLVVIGMATTVRAWSARRP